MVSVPLSSSCSNLTLLVLARGACTFCRVLGDPQLWLYFRFKIPNLYLRMVRIPNLLLAMVWIGLRLIIKEKFDILTYLVTHGVAHFIIGCIF